MLRQAGFDPDIEVSGVDEAVTETAPAAVVAVLAGRKAEAVAGRVTDALVLGCDSIVELGGGILGQPASAAEAAAWWRSMAGGTVRVWTGHCLIDTTTGRSAEWVADATVTFARPTDEEIDRYVATDEPLGAAGGFRLDDRAAAFIESIDGDPGAVHGVSIPVLRLLLGELDIRVTDLWR